MAGPALINNSAYIYHNKFAIMFSNKSFKTAVVSINKYNKWDFLSIVTIDFNC